MEAKATAKYVKGSSQKARLVIYQIRGKSVEEALGILQFSRKGASGPVEKVLRSAIANAEEKAPMVDVEELIVKEAYVGKGATKNRRRLRPAPMGRAFQQKRHQSHITIHVSDGKE